MTTYETGVPDGTGAPLHSRTHTWRPRPETTPEMLGMSGLEILQASLKGELAGASMASTLGFRLTEASEGFAVFEGDPGDHLLNPMGTVHGGFLATLLDSTSGRTTGSCTRTARRPARSCARAEPGGRRGRGRRASAGGGGPKGRRGRGRPRRPFGWIAAESQDRPVRVMPPLGRVSAPAPDTPNPPRSSGSPGSPAPRSASGRQGPGRGRSGPCRPGSRVSRG